MSVTVGIPCRVGGASKGSGMGEKHEAKKQFSRLALPVVVVADRSWRWRSTGILLDFGESI